MGNSERVNEGGFLHTAVEVLRSQVDCVEPRGSHVIISYMNQGVN